MEREQHEESVEDRLLGALIFQAENSSLPENLTEVQFNFQMQSLAYDPSNAQFHARMQLMMHWQDPRLRWQPDRFGRLTSFEHPNLQIWIPELVILKYVKTLLVQFLQYFLSLSDYYYKITKISFS